VFENRVLKRIYGPMREKVAEEDYTMMGFINCMLHQILLG
jgi:hypothetical protein